MKFEIQECSDSDMPRAFELLSVAFGHEHPYIEHVFPNHGTPEGRKIGAKRLLSFKQGDPTATWLKVVDIDSGKMVAHGKWIVLDGVIPPEYDLPGDFWETAEEKEYAQHMFREYLVPRRRAIKETGGRVVSLDLLTVDPDYQRRGAGRMLVKWGTTVADKLSVEAIVEATDYGVGLYQSEGFEIKEDYEISLPPKWADRERQRYTWMIRPVKTDKA